ncbi:hypothetical protein PYW08_005134 [Mythimna loreyi]|uniref:Uncharacterized protein n=1 Tax=Mythimna loreyi TaxID=667449 RepID=A0ACC2QER8_9NEOP|nr:hypothetical protein PYW08_005134 [Mythimna loreyi]
MLNEVVKESVNEEPGPSRKREDSPSGDNEENEEDEKDFSGSESSWSPNGEEDDSADSDAERNATNPKTSSDKPLQAAEEARETQEDDQKNTEELDRSDDNVLTTKTSKFAEKYEQVEDEWIPIGSGKTYVHKDCFKKERWRSYRLATRALLIGAFPRR